MKKDLGKFFKKNKKPILFFLPVLIVFFFDQLTKLSIRANFSLGESWSIFPNFFSLTYIQNTGAGFGLLRGFNLVLIFISILVMGVIMYYYREVKVKEKWLLLSMGLIFGGAFGNLIDRIAYGFVVDFLSFIFWPAFNIADMAISVGVIGLVIYFWKK